jgi:hypothetical protein
MLVLGGNLLFVRLGLETQPTKTPKTASPTKAETASGICPTNLRISAESSRMKTKIKTVIFYRNFAQIHSQKYFWLSEGFIVEVQIYRIDALFWLAFHDPIHK